MVVAIMNQIPRVVAEWIVLQLPENNDAGLASKLEYMGLNTLRVPELKTIGKALYATASVRDELTITVRTLPSSAKKQNCIIFVQRALYIDDTCTRLNDRLLNELQSEVLKSATATAAAQSPAAGHPSSTSTHSIGKKRSRRSTTPNGSSHTTTALALTDSSKKRWSLSPRTYQRNRAAVSTHAMPHASSSATWQRIDTGAARITNGHHFTSNSGQPSVGSLASSNRNLHRRSHAPSMHFGSSATAPSDFDTMIRENQNQLDLLREYFQNQQQHSFSSTSMPGAQLTSTATHPQQSLFHSASNGHDSQSSGFAGPASMSGAVAPGTNPFPHSTIPTGSANFSDHSSDPNQPKNATEFRIMSELAQMGFTDRQEMINGIRQSKKTTADEVMLFIVTQREEADEARKEDEVRLLSEEQKREQEQLKKAHRMEKLAGAKTGKDLRVIFDKSWVLGALLLDDGSSSIVDDALMKQRRTEFLGLLSLEEQSAKWYHGLPSYYFQNLCNRLKNDHGGTIDWLPVECERLKRGLTQLKEQVGGRPKLFVEAFDEATGGTDQEVIVID
jgi:hypothetical protein